MIVATFRFYERNNTPETETILANTIEEAEDYLRVLKRNGIYKIDNLNIEHSFVVGNATNFKVFSRDENGYPTVLDWRDKDSDDSGRVRYWTELPARIKTTR